jgi:hypothetical protein
MLQEPEWVAAEMSAISFLVLDGRGDIGETRDIGEYGCAVSC